MAEQPDGSYPRLNATLLQGGKYASTIISVVGKVETFDGQNIDLKSGDGVVAKIFCEPGADIAEGSIYEFIGHANENGTLQLFVTRELSVDMDLEIYDRMITQVQHNPKYTDYFAPIHS